MTEFMADIEQAFNSVANLGWLTLAGLLWTPLCNRRKLSLVNYLR